MLKVLVLLATAITAEAASITGCHFHGATQFCIDGEGNEGYVTPAPASTAAPKSYTGCHNHGSETFCFAEGDAEVQFVAEGDSKATGTSDSHDHDDEDDHHHHHHESSSDSSSQDNSSNQSIGTPLSLDSSVAHVTSAAAQTAAVTGCHFHGSSLFCKDGSGNEGYISPAPTTTPSSYTGCHNHGSATFCLDSSSGEVQFLVEDDDHDEHSGHGPSNLTSSSTTSSSANSTVSSATENFGRKLELSALAVMLSLVGML